MEHTLRIPPALLLGAAALAQQVAVRSTSPTRVPRSWRLTAATAVAGGSMWMLSDAVRRFVAGGTTVDPVDVGRATSLVVSGPFGVTRNPMYVGMAGLLLAHAVLRGTSWALPPAAVFVVLIDRSQIPAEEQALRRRFGTEYDVYAARTPRWLWSCSDRRK